MYTNLSFLPHQLGFASHVHGKVPGCNTDPTKVHYDTSQCYTKKTKEIVMNLMSTTLMGAGGKRNPKFNSLF